MTETHNDVSGFLKAGASKLFNGDGKEVLLRGAGTGGWFLPEGYMWKFPAEGDRPRRMEKKIAELLGEADALDFWEEYYNRFITEEDVKSMSSMGFNSVRLPLLARYLERGESAWQRVDRFLEWCRTHKLYVILDLHGAPGGQTGTNIDDSEHDQPQLFIYPDNRRKTVDLWRRIAERYGHDWIVGGYDLLNEPLPDWSSRYNDLVMPLYAEIISAIREVDTQHMIILEGVHWATDWSIFEELPDDNIMLQFHKYWNNPDTESIAKFLQVRRRLNVPIYMGEGGENNCDWYAGAFRLFEDHGISWNFWTWKKMQTTNSPWSISMPEGWSRLIDYVEARAELSMEEGRRILRSFLENMLIENCEHNPCVVHSLLRTVPCRIPAVFYSYSEGSDAFHFHKSSGEFPFRVGDGAEFYLLKGDRGEPNFQHGGGQPWADEDWIILRLSAGEYCTYEYRPAWMGRTPDHRIEIKLRSPAPSCDLAVHLDGEPIGRITELNAAWTVAEFDVGIQSMKDSSRITLVCEEGSVDVQYLKTVKT